MNKFAIIILSALGLWLTGCADELLQDTVAGDDGAMSRIDLRIEADVPFGDFRTRADALGNTDVTSLWVGVYDIQTGNRVGAAHFSSPYSPVTLPVIYYDQHPTVAIVGVANYMDDTDWEGTPLADCLDAALKWNDFVALNMRIPLINGAPAANSSASPVMAGLLTPDGSTRPFFKASESGAVAVENATGFEVNLTGNKIYGPMTKTIEGKKIYLKRLYSQVNVSIVAGQEAEVTDVSFRRCNMPLGVYLAEHPTYTNSVSTWAIYSVLTPNYADTKMEAKNGVAYPDGCYWNDTDWQPAARNNTFSFNHYENKHWAVPDKYPRSSRHEDREAKSGNVVAALGNTYNNQASYFVIRMKILDKQMNRSAYVEYTIHEGNINDPSGNYDSSESRRADYSAFRNTVYNYTINVNGINYIDYNISTTGHHDGASGEIWVADIKTLTPESYWEGFRRKTRYYTNYTMYARDANSVFRFYVARGADTPLDYLSGTMPAQTEAMYWPTINENTRRDNIPTGLGDRIKISQNGRYFNTLEDFARDARTVGGQVTYKIEFYPETTESQLYPEEYKMGFYYYNTGGATGLSGNDKGDHGASEEACTKAYANTVHVAEWKPAQKGAQQLGALRYYLPSPTLTRFVNASCEIDLNSAHAYSGNNPSLYGTKYIYNIWVNDNEYTANEDKKCTVPLSALAENENTYYAYASSLDLKQFSDSEVYEATITLQNPSWDFQSNEFSTWFNANFPVNNKGRHDSSEPESKDWKDGLSINISSGSTVGGPANDNALYFDNTGKNRNLQFTIFEDCKMKITANSNKNSELIVQCTGMSDQTINLTTTQKTETINLSAADGGSTVTIYQNTGSIHTYFYKIELTK